MEITAASLLTARAQRVGFDRPNAVKDWLADNKPDAVIVCAAKVGGILANDTYPADFLYDNLMIEANIIKAAHEVGVTKLLFLGSSCIYPKHAASPWRKTLC